MSQSRGLPTSSSTWRPRQSVARCCVSSPVSTARSGGSSRHTSPMKSTARSHRQRKPSMWQNVSTPPGPASDAGLTVTSDGDRVCRIGRSVLGSHHVTHAAGGIDERLVFAQLGAQPLYVYIDGADPTGAVVPPHVVHE